MAEVKIVVRHRLNLGEHRRTAATYDIPENINTANVAAFIAAMVEHTAAIHQNEYFGIPERSLVEAIRRQTLTGILNDALEGPGRRLAERALEVLALSDEQLMESQKTVRRGGRFSG